MTSSNIRKSAPIKLSNRNKNSIPGPRMRADKNKISAEQGMESRNTRHWHVRAFISRTSKHFATRLFSSVVALLIANNVAATGEIEVPSPIYTSGTTAVVPITGYCGQTHCKLEERVGSGSWNLVKIVGMSSYTFSPTRGIGSYSYRLARCNNISSCSSYSPTTGTTIKSKPASPPSLTAPTSDGDGTYTVTVGSVADATQYKIFVQINNGSWTSVGTWSSASSISQTRGNGKYAYRAQACNPGGCSAYSATRTVTVAIVPKNLQVPGSSYTGSFRINWSSVSGATRYEWQQKNPNGSLESLRSATSAYADVTVSQPGAHGYRVRSCSSAGCSGYTSYKTIAINNPGIPQNVQVSTTSTPGDFRLSWNAAAGATRYEWQWKMPNGTLDSAHSTTSTAAIVAISQSGIHSYRVRSCSAIGCSNYSVYKTVTLDTPAVPQNLQVPGTNNTGNFNISWNTVPGAMDYQWQQKNPNGALQSPKSTTSTQASVTVSQPGIYEYRVRSCSFVGCSNYTAFKALTLIPAQVDLEYRYDALGRLRQVRKDGAQDVEYNYDEAGNRTSVQE